MKKTNELNKIDGNLIYLGRKPLMSNVLSVLTQFNGNGTKDVILKTRGRSISATADTAEIVRNSFRKNGKVKHITINTKSPRNKDQENQIFHQLKYVLQQSRKTERENNAIKA